MPTDDSYTDKTIIQSFLDLQIPRPILGLLTRQFAALPKANNYPPAIARVAGHDYLATRKASETLARNWRGGNLGIWSTAEWPHGGPKSHRNLGQDRALPRGSVMQCKPQGQADKA